MSELLHTLKMKLPEVGDQMGIYRCLVREIHLAMESGDDMATMGLPGMIARKEQLERVLGVSPDVAVQVFDSVTADSPYRANMHRFVL